jgi:hypothetical protein
MTAGIVYTYQTLDYCMMGKERETKREGGREGERERERERRERDYF